MTAEYLALADQLQIKIVNRLPQPRRRGLVSRANKCFRILANPRGDGTDPDLSTRASPRSRRLFEFAFLQIGGSTLRENPEVE